MNQVFNSNFFLSLVTSLYKLLLICFALTLIITLISCRHNLDLYDDITRPDSEMAKIHIQVISPCVTLRRIKINNDQVGFGSRLFNKRIIPSVYDLQIEYDADWENCSSYNTVGNCSTSIELQPGHSYRFELRAKYRTGLLNSAIVPHHRQIILSQIDSSDKSAKKHEIYCKENSLWDLIP